MKTNWLIQQPAKSIGLAFLLFLACYCSGNKSKEYANRTVVDTSKKESIDISQESDTVRSAAYNSMLNYFLPKDNSVLDTTVQIPYSCFDTLLQSEIADTSSGFYSGINPIRRIKNKHGDFFIIRLNCTAGGDCALYYLLAFNAYGKFRSLQKLGSDAGEYSESTYFEYHLQSDTVLLTNQIRYDNEKEVGIDTVRRLVQLRFP